MSWFKRDGSLRSSFSRRSSLLQSRQPLDAMACLEAFQMHWLQAWQIMDQNNLSQATPSADDVTSVLNHLDQMVTLLIQECANNLMDNGKDEKGKKIMDATVPAMFGPLLDYMLIEDVLQKLFIWSCHCGENQNVMKLEQLKIYELLVSHSKHELLFQKSVVWPMVQLLSTCSECAPVEVEKRLVVLLNTLCVTMNQNPQLLEVFFTVSSSQESARFLVFSLLIPFVHREGAIGQQARDALLLCMSLSRKDESIGLYIAEHSNFCPVLATGLSGLYSLLPRKLPLVSHDWHRFTPEDIQEMPELAMFLNSLEFCNAVVQVAHPMVQEQLLEYVYQGFLIPVLGPALHQDVLGSPLVVLLDEKSIEPTSVVYSNSVEEIIAATAYLELFLRTVTEPALLQVFLRFILSDRFDGHLIIETLIARLGAQSRLCVVTMALFRTLLDLNCEDVLLELVLKYLLPCSHVMVSQRSRVRDIDMYCRSAEKFLSLIPSCCSSSITSSSSSSRSSSPAPSPAHPIASSPFPNLPLDGKSSSSLLKRGSLGIRSKARRHRRSPSTNSFSFGDADASWKADPPVLSARAKLEYLQTCYLDYLLDARREVKACARACRCWGAPYDGLNPPTTVVTDSVAKRVDDPCAMRNGGEKVGTEEPDPVPESDMLVDNVESNSMIIIPEQSEASAQLMERIGPKNVNSEGGIINLSEDIPDAEKMTVASTVLAVSKLSLGKMSDQEYDQAFWNVLQSTKTPSSLSDGEDFFEFSETSEVPNEALSNGEYSSLDTVNLPSGGGTKCESSPSDSGMFESRESNSSSLDREASAAKVREWCSRGGAAAAAGEATTEQQQHRKMSSSWSSFSILQASDEHASSSDAKRFLSSSSGGRSRTSPSPSGATTPAGAWGESFGSPDIGPFLGMLLMRLETMPQNDVYVNLQLTGLISRLAVYPQPLLQSFLLNHSLVFQPSIRSLFQVLGSLKHKVDSYAHGLDNFDDLLVRARQFLLAREERLLGNGPPRIYCEPPLPFPNARRSSSPEVQRGESRRRSFTNLLFGRSGGSNEKKKRSNTSISMQEPILESIADGQGYRYVNKVALMEDGDASSLFGDPSETRNAVLCAVVLEEFLKELAAISQEHAILQADPEFWDCR